MLRRHAIPILAAVLVVGIAVPVSTPFAIARAGPAVRGSRAHRALRVGGRRRGGAIALAQLVKMDHPVEPVVDASCSSPRTVGRGALRGAAARGRRRASASCWPRRAAAEERLRIARELHDAVGHDVSLMVVQAEALAAVTGDERADAIAALGRRTMGEMHRTLKVLRDEAELAPQPGLDDLGGVLDGARAAGVPITLAVEGAPRALAAGAGRVRVPDRAGGGDQRDPPRRRRARGGHRPLRRRRARAASSPTRAARAEHRQRRPRPGRDARAGRGVRRHARAPARATATASRSGRRSRTT